MTRLATALLRGLSSGGAVICFHSVTTAEWPSASLVHVPLEAFRRTIELARELGEIVPLADMVSRQVAGRSTAGLVAVTCDDAYAALLYEAGEFLRNAAVPLTIFVVTEAAREGSRYWWDRIDDLFPLLSPRRWRRFEDECGLPDEYRQGQPRHFGPLRPFRQWMLATWRGRWTRALEATLAALEQEAGAATKQRSMTYEELARFTAVAPVTIGVHTLTHPVLPLLSEDDMKVEIQGCFEQLHDRFAGCVPILAAPFGLFDASTIKVARESGMAATLTLGGSTLWRLSPERGLPRFCQTAADKPWRTALRLSGIVERVTPTRWAGLPYPELPSQTS